MASKNDTVGTKTAEAVPGPLQKIKASLLVFVRGDLLDAKEDYIAHQCNTLTVRPHGLSKDIARKWPHANVYGRRKPVGCANLAQVAYRPKTGSILVDGSPLTAASATAAAAASTTKRGVIHMFGQLGMSTPHSFNNKDAKHGEDDYGRRIGWFRECLSAVAKIPGITSVAMPYQIGCGLAGGNWERDYRPVLEKFAAEHSSIRVVIYRK